MNTARKGRNTRNSTHSVFSTPDTEWSRNRSVKTWNKTMSQMNRKKNHSTDQKMSPNETSATITMSSLSKWAERNGHAVANFRLAVTSRIREGDSWKDGETSFFRINVWRQQAENVAESLAKGNRVIVSGRLKSRAWETPQGDKRSIVEIDADEVGPSLKWATARPERANSDRHQRRAVQRRAADLLNDR